MSPTPISELRLAANRANVLKSTGPRTPAGKRKSSQNACQYHLYARKFAMSPEAQAANEARARRDSAHVQDSIVRELHYRLILATGHCEWNWSVWDGLEAFAHNLFPGDPQMAIYWMCEQHGFLLALHRHESFYSRQIMAIVKTLETLDKPGRKAQPGRVNAMPRTPALLTAHALPQPAPPGHLLPPGEPQIRKERTQSAPHLPLPSQLEAKTPACPGDSPPPATHRNSQERTQAAPHLPLPSQPEADVSAGPDLPRRPAGHQFRKERTHAAAQGRASCPCRRPRSRQAGAAFANRPGGPPRAGNPSHGPPPTPPGENRECAV